MDSRQIKDLINRTLRIMGNDTLKYAGPNVVSIVHRTALTESRGYEFVRQVGGGPGRGHWQVEPDTAEDLLFRYLLRASKESLRAGIVAATGLILWENRGLDDKERPVVVKAPEFQEPGYLGHILETNIALGIVLCRLRYWTQKGSGPVPDAAEMPAVAAYWKRWYNTPGGGGTVEHFIDMVNRYEGGANG